MNILIPGLAMNSCELPILQSNTYSLQNPEINDTLKLRKDYSLEDVADHHADKIVSLMKQNEFNSSKDTLNIFGMSMGGMILSIIATKHRELLPQNSNFYFLVTSANLETNRAVSKDLEKRWFTAIPGDEESFKSILEPFFSKDFVHNHGKAVSDYISYRANGKNGQLPEAFLRQLNALKRFNGEHYFPKLNPQETTIISGKEDYILGSKHHVDLIQLVPGAREKLVEGLGHMVNLEMPFYFSKHGLPD